VLHATGKDEESCAEAVQVHGGVGKRSNKQRGALGYAGEERGVEGEGMSEKSAYNILLSNSTVHTV